MGGAARAVVTEISVRMPMARLGGQSRLPRFRWQQPIPDSNTPMSRGLSAEESADAFQWGKDSILPYRVQDDYDRVRVDADMPLVVLDNGCLRASFAPQYGGRLMSLYDYGRQRELLFANPVFQPANLAALNAWFSGGIEWNGLIPGHTPFSLVPVFAGVRETPDGPVLRFYEFDRIVEASWQIDVFLPPGEDRLYVHGRIVNPDAAEKRAYWWTNVAVPCTEGMRVIAPATHSIEHVLPGNELARFPFPDPGRFDGSYPGKWRGATSVFFRKPGATRLFIAGLDTGGVGLAQTATARMVGRKFFYFGTGSGGRHWMDYLSEKGRGEYIEIQSGLMPTQNQRFVLPGHAEVEWTEVYGALEADPRLVTAADYAEAERGVALAIDRRFPEGELGGRGAFLSRVAHEALDKRLSAGTAWGARHEVLTKKPVAAGLDFAVPGATDFWDAIAAGEALASALLSRVPDDIAVSPRWVAALKGHAARHGQSWLHDLLLGIAALDREDRALARTLTIRSVAIERSWLGLRQLALLETDPKGAETLYLQAWGRPDAPPELAVEIANFLFRQDRIAALDSFLAGLAPEVAGRERLRLLRASMAARAGDFALLAQLLDFEPATIREGEDLSAELWKKLQAGLLAASLGREPTAPELAARLKAHPLPEHLDFRMRAEISDERA